MFIERASSLNYIDMKNLLIILAGVAACSAGCTAYVAGPPVPGPAVVSGGVVIEDRPYYTHGPRYYSRGSVYVWRPGHYVFRDGRRVWIHGRYEGH